MKTTGRSIKQITSLAGVLVRDQGGIDRAQAFIPLPPAPNWFARGPRGGVYVAVGQRERRWSNEHGDDWMKDQWSVLDESEDSRYVRPGTALHKQATS